MNIGKLSIKATVHFVLHHSDVEWDLIVATILSPSYSHPSKRHGKNRFTYVKRFRKFAIEVHTEHDYAEGIVWVINAFKMER